MSDPTPPPDPEPSVAALAGQVADLIANLQPTPPSFTIVCPLVLVPLVRQCAEELNRHGYRISVRGDRDLAPPTAYVIRDAAGVVGPVDFPLAVDLGRVAPAALLRLRPIVNLGGGS